MIKSFYYLPAGLLIVWATSLHAQDPLKKPPSAEAGRVISAEAQLVESSVHDTELEAATSAEKSDADSGDKRIAKVRSELDCDLDQFCLP